MLRHVMAAAALSVLAFGACTSEEPALEGTPPAETEAAGGPSLSIATPADLSTVPAGDVTVTVAVESFDIVDKLSQPAVEGEGHVHFYIDVEELPTEAGKPAITTDAKTYHAAATTTYSWPDVAAGNHTFSAQLVNNDHTPLSPPVTAFVKVTVE